MKDPKKILIIIQRSNGDVFLSSNLISILYTHYDSPKIDLLINDDTFLIAQLIPHINYIHQFSYGRKKKNRWRQEKELIKNIYRNYDLSINLTASDRSVIYALLASKISISAIEKENHKSWWKKIFLSYFYYFDLTNHILVNNSAPLKCLKISHQNIHNSLFISEDTMRKIEKKLKKNNIGSFLIFHPSAQYNYKIYPKSLRNDLLLKLNSLGIPIIVTGGNSKIDIQIKADIPKAQNIFNFIGETSLEEFFALSQLSKAYIGMDTLNMHIAASQNKNIFAIFGSTNLSMWSPWSNKLQSATNENKPLQKYDNITIFQSSVPCKICGKIGCGNNHGSNEFPSNIEPDDIFNEIEKWYRKAKI